jgi:hypothetical protein
MAEEKVSFFNKFLIVVLMIYAFSRLSKLDLSEIKKTFEGFTKQEPVKTTRQFVPAPPAPQPIIIKEYVQVPVQMPPQQAVQMERPRAAPQVIRQSVSGTVPPNKIHVDDATFHRLFG